MQRVTVRIPASTSNLGPGFDCLGVALRVYNQITIAKNEASRPNEMIGDAARKFFSVAKIKPFPFSSTIAGEVPIARGLGSSVTVRLGVLHGLNHLANEPLNRSEIFEICAGLEGHPDNAAPASFGGFNVVRGANHQQFPVSANLHFVLLIPDFEVRTSEARRLLSTRIARLAAVESCGNACAITAAFAARDYAKLRGCFVDHFHQPFRKKMIPNFDRIVAAAETAGALGAFLSGSGSTIAALSLADPDRVARAMLAASKNAGAQTLITAADNRGARILTR